LPNRADENDGNAVAIVAGTAAKKMKTGSEENMYDEVSVCDDEVSRVSTDESKESPEISKVSTCSDDESTDIDFFEIPALGQSNPVVMKKKLSYPTSSIQTSRGESGDAFHWDEEGDSGDDYSGRSGHEGLDIGGHGDDEEDGYVM
jgi:hypothetical protein